MKYLVTVEGMRTERKCLTVEGATEREAGDSATSLIGRLYPDFNPDTLKAVKVEELKPEPSERGRTAYLRQVI